MKKLNILLIDDDKEILDYLKEYFELNNYNTYIAETGYKGIDLYKKKEIDIVITDLILPDIDGVEVIKIIKEINKDTFIFAITGTTDKKLIKEVMEKGASDLIRKPFSIKKLKYLFKKVENYYLSFKKRDISSFIQWDKKHIRINNDITIVTKVVDYIFENCVINYKNEIFLKIALQEIIINAIEHGNLKISHEDKKNLILNDTYLEFVINRANDKKYKNTYVDIYVFSNNDYLKIIVKDMGDGFDYTSIPDPEDPDNFFKEFGRGIFIAKNAFDKIEFNDIGNKVILYKFVDNKKESEIEFDRRDTFEVIDMLKSYEEVKETLDWELGLAAQFQRGFLPKKEELLEFDGINVDYFFQPLMNVSGDFIDISKLDEGIYGFFISDISGHGVSAALMSSMLKVFFSLYAADVLSPQIIYEILNKEFYNLLDQGEYFTSFYANYFSDERKLIYTNANHPYPLVYRKSEDKFYELETEGFFIGVFPDMEFEEKEFLIEPKDRLILYTDGITEAMNENKVQFGIKKLKQIIREEANSSIYDTISIVKNAVKRYTNNKIKDDLTLIIIEFE